MNVIIRKSNQSDLYQIYKLNIKCFSDPYDEKKIVPYLNDSFVVEITNLNKIIGVLLQGKIITQNTDLNTNITDSYYKLDAFTPLNHECKLLLENTIYKNLYGIVLLYIDSNFRSQGFAQKLIKKHWQDNNCIKYSCLNVRRSNTIAYHLYKSLGYQDIAIIKNNYFNEDSIFMVKDLTTLNNNS